MVYFRGREVDFGKPTAVTPMPTEGDAAETNSHGSIRDLSGRCCGTTRDAGRPKVARPSSNSVVARAVGAGASIGLSAANEDGPTCITHPRPYRGWREFFDPMTQDEGRKALRGHEKVR